MEPRNSPIAFDFDGTITLHSTYPYCKEIRPRIADCIRKLALAGHPIIIHTCRSTTNHDATEAFADMVTYLRDHGVMYSTINSNANPNSRFNPTKPYAVIYVDDSALGFDNDWDGDMIYSLIMEKLSGKTNSSATLVNLNIATAAILHYIENKRNNITNEEFANDIYSVIASARITLTPNNPLDRKYHTIP